MILYPDILRKAQAEIDALLDGESMPTFEHLDHLPYSVALTKEVFRWMPTAPGGFPHYSDAEDEYKGYKVIFHLRYSLTIYSPIVDQSKYNGNSLYLVHAGTFVVTDRFNSC